MNNHWNTITAIATLASLLLVLFDYLFPLNGTEKLLVYIFDGFVVVLLARDFYFRIRESDKKLRFILIHWYEVPAMMPLFLLSAFPYNIKWVAFFRTARLYTLVSRLGNSEIVLLVLFVTVTIIVGAFAEYLVEASDSNASITTPSQALWWAVETITTVAYGEYYPVTFWGKIVATLVAFVGIGMLWAVIPILTSKFTAAKLKQAKKADLLDDSKQLIKDRIDVVEKLNKEDLERLIAMIRSLNGRAAGE
ncbi:MAG TPA: potassium channel family protein [Nitrososphaeraceae archaeon]|jgi:voltage-gated potassium channel|nr:potassium channel family protein [Nitrososphaeraceae archaeon]